ncbi:CBS domain-containing protein [Bdellovibrio bacteriovorus]|uniref:CBS domain-containing protein n=1 Tax=Bdellovibrio bacteriovorus TaxID=959 RepID=UPI0035A6E9E4
MKAKFTSPESDRRTHRPHLEWEKSEIISIDPEASLTEAAELMKEYQIGDVLVMHEDGHGSLLGILTDRDIAMCIADGANPDRVRVGRVMSRSPITARAEDDVFTMISLMKRSGVTRLPLLDRRGRLTGVATAKNMIEILTGALFDLTQIGETQHDNEWQKH